MPKIVFVATEDWFFASHFLPMARTAVGMGLETVVVARERSHRGAIEATGARLVPLEAERRSLDPRAVWRTARDLAALLRREKPDIVHCISLKPMLIGGAAARLAGLRGVVFALTGLGFLGARQDRAGRGARFLLRRILLGALATGEARFLFENRDDPELIGLRADDPRVVVVGGAGIDPGVLPALPMPSGETLRIAIVARMLWSKGIDTAVEAVGLARRAGAMVELSLFGAPDPSNPRAIAEATLREWSQRPGIQWWGPTRDVGAVWAAHHLACLPSRGGEGLPRTLLESASSGRAALTTDVPGCRSFVRDGLDGLVVPPDDPQALADAIVALARDRAQVAALGASAAARVRAGYTEADVRQAMETLYREMLDG